MLDELIARSVQQSIARVRAERGDHREILFRRFLRQWEWTLVLLLVLVFAINSRLSPHFLDLRNLLDSTLHFTEKGIIALSMTLVVISGNIDLSVASTMAMSAAVMGVAYRAAWRCGWLSSFAWRPACAAVCSMDS